MKLSVAIITYNEERKLRQTLEAVRDIASEIVIVDSNSTDRTGEIAQNFGAKLILREWPGYSAQKNFLLDQCQGEWILLIDADEVITPELAGEIQKICEDPKSSDIYEIPFLCYCFGTQVRYGGWSGFYKIRLFKSGAIRFGKELVHEMFVPRVGSTYGKTKGLIHHYTYLDIEECMTKYNEYSTAGAKDLYAKGRQSGFLKCVIHPLAMFLKFYVLKLGFLDGFAGFVLSVYSAMYDFSKYAKLEQIYRQKGQQGKDLAHQD